MSFGEGGGAFLFYPNVFTGLCKHGVLHGEEMSKEEADKATWFYINENPDVVMPPPNNCYLLAGGRPGGTNR